jgi:predicted amidohydrolase YtcJ
MRRLRKIHADMILMGANIVTLNERQPRAQAVAIKDGEIIDVGSNSKIKRLAGKNTSAIDLRGKTVLPGLIDAHAHMIALGHPFPWLELRGVSSIKEIQRKLKAEAQEAEKGKWILGRGWDQDRLREKRYPTRWDLDKVSPHNPVLLNRVCGHVGVANSRALEVANIDEESAASWGELVDKDPTTGQPTGILRENAMDLVWNLPEPSEENLLKACHTACMEAVKAGLTSVHWFVHKPTEIRALKMLLKRKQLPLRVYVVIPMECLETFKNERFSEPFLKLNCVKIFTDGSLGARTAALQEPYADDPTTKGVLCHSIDELKAMIKSIDDVGFQIAVHAIGDAAIDETLTAFNQALGKVAIKEHRHRIEHISVLNPYLIEQMKALGLSACVQPHFVISDFWVPNRLGQKRARWTYPFKTLWKNAILVAASSDTPAEPINPFLGIWAAVARKSFPEERISVEQALQAYTANAAYLSFEENAKGSIEVGKFADFTVVSNNPLSIEAEKIRDIKVVLTIVGGKIVYSAQD